VHETRLLAKAAAANPKLATQMEIRAQQRGIAAHHEVIASGVWGRIREVHI
jgi:hypothetical protein